MRHAYLIISLVLGIAQGKTSARGSRASKRGTEKRRTERDMRLAGAAVVSIALAGSALTWIGGGVPMDVVAASVGTSGLGPEAYVANSFDNAVSPIDAGSNIGGSPIGVGTAPAAVALTPDAKTAYVANWADDSVTPIATATRTPGTPIPVTDPVALAEAPIAVKRLVD